MSDKNSDDGTQGRVKRLGNLFFGILFAACIAIIVFSAVNIDLSRIAAKEERVLLYPSPEMYDPRPDRNHATWGQVEFDIDPAVFSDSRINRGRFCALYPARFARQKWPTIVWGVEDDPNVFYASIDGTNEASERDPFASHTIKLPGGLRPGERVEVSMVSGTLTNFAGCPLPMLSDRGRAFGAQGATTTPGQYLIKGRDSYSVNAPFVRLQTARGAARHLHWEKLCYAEGKNVRGGNYNRGTCWKHVDLKNIHPEPAHVEIRVNVPIRSLSHLHGTPHAVLGWGGRDMGWDGNRALIRIERLAH